MHAIMTGMAEVNSNALLEATFGGGCRGLLVPSPHVGSGRTPEQFGAAQGGDSMRRGPSSSGLAPEPTCVAAGAHRARDPNQDAAGAKREGPHQGPIELRSLLLRFEPSNTDRGSLIACNHKHSEVVQQIQWYS